MWHLNRYGKTLLEREYDYDFQSSITSRGKIALGMAEGVVEGREVSDALGVGRGTRPACSPARIG